MNTLLMKRFIFMALFSVLLAACATQRMSNVERTDAYNKFIETEKLESLRSISAFRFDGWNSLGQEHLIMSTRVNRPYLITLRARCLDLRYATAIIFNNTGSTLQAGFDSISVPGSLNIRCYIKTIHKLTREQKSAITKIGRNEEEAKDAPQ